MKVASVDLLLCTCTAQHICKGLNRSSSRKEICVLIRGTEC